MTAMTKIVKAPTLNDSSLLKKLNAKTTQIMTSLIVGSSLLIHKMAAFRRSKVLALMPIILIAIVVVSSIRRQMSEPTFRGRWSILLRTWKELWTKMAPIPIASNQITTSVDKQPVRILTPQQRCDIETNCMICPRRFMISAMKTSRT